MRTMKHGINIGFSKGVHIEDKYGRLAGRGKVMRVLPLDSADIEIIQYFMDQAVRINAEKI